MTTEPKTNYDLFIETVYNLKYSKGFYQRLWNNIQQQDEEELKYYLNNLDIKFKDSVDVILWIEG